MTDEFRGSEMTTRFNIFILAAAVAGVFAVGMAGAESNANANAVGAVATSAPTFSASLTPDGLLTVDYRGEQLSVFARVPLLP